VAWQFGLACEEKEEGICAHSLALTAVTLLPLHRTPVHVICSIFLHACAFGSGALARYAAFSRAACCTRSAATVGSAGREEERRHTRIPCPSSQLCWVLDVQCVNSGLACGRLVAVGTRAGVAWRGDRLGEGRRRERRRIAFLVHLPVFFCYAALLPSSSVASLTLAWTITTWAASIFLRIFHRHSFGLTACALALLLRRAAALLFSHWRGAAWPSFFFSSAGRQRGWTVGARLACAERLCGGRQTTATAFL